MTDASMPAHVPTLRPPRRAALFAVIWLLGSAVVAAALLGRLPALPAVLSAVLLAALTLLGAFSQRVGFYASPINAIARQAAGKTICLTFDDGPDPHVTPKVVQLLARRGHRCTFFVIGQQAAAHPELIEALAAAGHEVAVHSMKHAWHLCFWPPYRIVEELRAVAKLVAAAGVRATPLFRPPNGILSPRIPVAVDRAGMQLIGYSRRAYDRAPRATAEACLRRLRPHLHPGAILVLHDSAEVSLDVLPPLLDALERDGLKSVPVGEAIGLPVR